MARRRRRSSATATPPAPFQGFQLKQAPLTYVSAATETGAASTLELRVNDVLWDEAPTLYGRAARERVFETRTTDEGATIVQFGDGDVGRAAADRPQQHRRQLPQGDRPGRLRRRPAP